MNPSERPVALVTGARRGIGRACATALASAGFDIAATDLVVDADSQAALAAFRDAGATAAFFQHDVADISSHAALIEAIVAQFGRLDCLVNNAGRGPVVRGDILDLLPENYDIAMAVNVRGGLFLTQAVARLMLAGAQPATHRTIIAITSVSAETVSLNRVEYCIAKAGMAMAMRAFALRLAPHAIAVFEVRPGIIRTAMTQAVEAQYDEMIGAGLVPARRWGEPADVGRVVAALASGQFGFATGSVIASDGGLSLPRL
jgi:3-oxoacyl-[acyl-carrier protein] reductase